MKVGLKRFYVANYTESGNTVTYSNGKCVAKATKLDSSPEFYNQEFYADNAVDDMDAGFKKVNLTVGVNGIDFEDEATLFGYDYTAESGDDPAKIESVNTSEGNEVGIGFVVTSRKSNTTKFVGIVYHKVKFTEGSESIETKGESVKMDADTLSGVGMVDANGKWRTKFECATEAAAEAAVKGFLSIS